MQVLWINEWRALPSAFVLEASGTSGDRPDTHTSPLPHSVSAGCHDRVITEVIYNRARSTPCLTTLEHHLQEPASGTGLANATLPLSFPAVSAPAPPTCRPSHGALADLTLLSPPPALRGRAEGTGGGGAQGQGVCGGVRMRPLTLVALPLSAGGGKVLGQGQLETSQGSHLPWGEPSKGPGLVLWASPISAPQPSELPRVLAHLVHRPTLSHTQLPGPSSGST